MIDYFPTAQGIDRKDMVEIRHLFLNFNFSEAAKKREQLNLKQKREKAGENKEELFKL